MQAIQTRYAGPTNHRGARIVARCDARRAVYSWDHSLNVPDNHAMAARSLAHELGWLDGHRIESGSLPDGSYAHVLVAESPGALASRTGRFPWDTLGPSDGQAR